MNRSELVSALSVRFPELGAGDVDASVKTIVEAIGNSLMTGKRVEIRGFGTFNVTMRSGRASRNPKTGEPVRVPPKAMPRFKPGQLLRQRVDSSFRDMPAGRNDAAALNPDRTGSRAPV